MEGWRISGLLYAQGSHEGKALRCVMSGRRVLISGLSTEQIEDIRRAVPEMEAIAARRDELPQEVAEIDALVGLFDGQNVNPLVFQLTGLLKAIRMVLPVKGLCSSQSSFVDLPVRWSGSDLGLVK